MTDAMACEFPFVEGLPTREKTKVRKVWDQLEELRAVVASKGQLLPIGFVAQLGSVSTQRIHQLTDAGTLERVEIDGHPFITESSLLAWLRSERKTGRPPKGCASAGAVVKSAVAYSMSGGK